MNRPARTRHLRRILSLLAAALVFVQVLGLMHAVLHDHARVGGHAPAAANRPGEAVDQSLIASLFSEHDSAADCDRFDHITHADPVCSDAPQLALRHANHVEAVGVHAGWHIAHQAAGFLARGPPSQV